MSTSVLQECLHPMHNDPADLAVNFLESGGDSLSALRFVSRVEAHFGGVALPDLLDVTLHQTLTDVLVCVRRTLRTHGHLDTATEDTSDSMGGNGGRMTSGQDYGQAHSLGGEKGDDQTVSMSDKSCHSLTESHVNTVSVRNEPSHSLTESHVNTVSVTNEPSHSLTESHVNPVSVTNELTHPPTRSQLKHQKHSSRKRKLSTAVCLNEEERYSCYRHKEQCLQGGLIESCCTNVENQEILMRNTNLFVCSVERGNRTCADVSSPTYCMSVVLTGEHIPADTPSATGEHIPADTLSATGEHIPADILSATGEHIPADTPSATGEHILIDTPNATGEHIPADTPSATGEHISADTPSITVEHISVDTPNITGEHILVDTPNITGEHISVETPNIIGEHISVETPNITGEHISVGTPVVQKEHISADTSSVREETVGAGTNMAADRGIMGRHPSQHTWPLQANDITDLSCLVVMETWHHNTGKCVDASPLVAIHR